MSFEPDPTEPLDQEFLEELMRNTAAPHLATLRDWLVEQAHEAIDEQIKNGIIDLQDREKYLKIRIDGIDPVRGFQGEALLSIKARALECLGTERLCLENIPVGALSIVELNAFAIPTPRGGAAVALNASLLSL